MAVALMAVPAQSGVWKMLLLEDGTQVRGELHGDEYGHFWTTDDGRHYVEIVGTDFYREVDLSEVLEAAQARRAEEAQLAQGTLTAIKRDNAKKLIPGGTSSEFSGEKKGLIILVNFADVKFEEANDADYYERLANEENFSDSYGNTHSVRDYFLDQSYGTFDLSFDVVGPVELQNGYAYYGNESTSGRIYLVQEACDGADNLGVDYSKYDWDGDGEVEQVFILYAGHGAADSGDSKTVWPHKGTISARTYDGVKVRTYACSCELAGRTDGVGNGIGTICHEFSHCMGLPDAYDTQYTGFYAMGTWSIMASGSYNGGSHGYLPAGYTSYERACCGWLTPVELTEETEVTDMKGLSEGGEAYIYYNKGTDYEFYMMENRTNNGFDSSLSGSGLLVVHLDYNAYYWTANVLNSNYYGNDHERYTIVPADNVKSSGSESNDTWPNSGNSRLDNYTTPADEAYNANSDGAYYMNMSLSSIKKADDGTISFQFYPEGRTPTTGTAPEGAIFYESFNLCSGTGGNDGDFGSSGVGNATFYPDINDWTCSTAHGAWECAFFGSNTQAANLTTPTFAITGPTTLSFRAAPYTALVPAVIAISCETEGISVSPTEIEVPQGEWTDFNIVLKGEGDVKLRMKETTGINRFFLDEVAAVPGLPEGISTITADKPIVSGVYSIDGIYLGTSTDGLKKGIYIVDGRKMVK